MVNLGGEKSQTLAAGKPAAPDRGLGSAAKAAQRSNAPQANALKEPSTMTLSQWIYQSLGQSQLRVRTRLRGNHLHVLLEGPRCPEAAQTVALLAPGFTQPTLMQLLPEKTPPIYQVIIYGRQLDQSVATWTQALPVSEQLIAGDRSGVTSTPAMPVAVDPLVPTPAPHPLGRAATTVQAALQSSLLPADASPADASPADASPTNSSPAELQAPKLQGPELLQGAKLPEPKLQGLKLDGTSQRPNGPGPTAEASPSPSLNTAALGREVAQPSLLEMAKQGHPRAIARFLSQALSQFGIAVRAKVEPIPQSQSRRLMVLCEASYLLEPRQLAEPLAKRLRSLELAAFQDAIVYGQVAGEAKPEWALRIDLTPPDVLLQYWARWGDVQSIVQLLNRRFQSSALRLTALQTDSTLHVLCQAQAQQTLDAATVAREMGPILASFKPQGLPQAYLYGVGGDRPAVATIPTDPLWTETIALPAAELPTLAATPLELAQQGDLEAIGFLLDRGLNPHLEQKLATGGLRVQVRQQNDLLFVMVDGASCPVQSAIAPMVVKFLKPLKLEAIAGLRIYGRMAGEKHPRWSCVEDFGERKRLVPTAAPEFAASAAYVGELLAEPAGPLVKTDSGEPDWQQADWWDARREMLQRMLIATQVFRPIEPDVFHLSPVGSETDAGALAETAGSSRHSGAIALVWSLVGACLLGWSDQWIGAQLKIHPDSAQATTSNPATPMDPALPKLSLQKTKGFEGYSAAGGFTRKNGVSLAENLAEREANLPASILQPKASTVLKPLDHPSFNSRQLDEKIALYQQYVELNGAPDVLIIGSSRALRGVDPAALKQFLAQQGYRDLKVFNFGVNGATAQVVDFTLRQLLPPTALPKMVLWADGARAFNSGRTDLTFKSIAQSKGYQALVAGQSPFRQRMAAQASTQASTQAVPTTPDAATSDPATPNPVTAASNGYQLLSQQMEQRITAISPGIAQRDRIKGWAHEQMVSWLPKGDPMALVGEALTDSLGNTSSPAAEAAALPSADGTGLVDLDGFLPLPHRFNPATYYQKHTRVSGDFDSDYENFALQGKQTEALTSLATFTQARQITLVFVNLPLTTNYLDPVRRRHETTFTQALQQASRQLGFIYRDFGSTLAVDYFSDPSHLNRYGGYEVSRRLATDVLMPWSQIKPRTVSNNTPNNIPNNPPSSPPSPSFRN